MLIFEPFLFEISIYTALPIHPPAPPGTSYIFIGCTLTFSAPVHIAVLRIKGNLIYAIDDDSDCFFANDWFECLRVTLVVPQIRCENKAPCFSLLSVVARAL
ncbi:unnamed protein product [Leptosia nina]|uniref:Uncharacterized protein n=1 Tax=Leptosia nina TaxID=320188 RepID=A0AAV1JWF8_9NEOP